MSPTFWYTWFDWSMLEQWCSEVCSVRCISHNIYQTLKVSTCVCELDYLHSCDRLSDILPFGKTSYKCRPLVKDLDIDSLFYEMTRGRVNDDRIVILKLNHSFRILCPPNGHHLIINVIALILIWALINRSLTNGSRQVTRPRKRSRQDNNSDALHSQAPLMNVHIGTTVRTDDIYLRKSRVYFKNIVSKNEKQQTKLCLNCHIQPHDVSMSDSLMSAMQGFKEQKS